MKKRKRIPSLPRLLKSKIYKTGQTRGADDDQIFQNRVNRNSTVLIPYNYYEACKFAPDNNGFFENGMIVLINPSVFFETKNFEKLLASKGLVLGKNALLFYYSRQQWNKYNPQSKGLLPATSRNSPLGGKYVARVPSTTAKGEQKISHGFTTSKLKGAGIRVYEYASKRTIAHCHCQLEYVFWKCKDSHNVLIQEGMNVEQIEERKNHIFELANDLGLDNSKKLADSRILNKAGNAICPLCLEEISAQGFFSKVKQAEGREISDLTVTTLNLFHIQELRTGQFNHKTYNLGWGHHHCNVVVKDTGIDETLTWMSQVLERNKKHGFNY